MSQLSILEQLCYSTTRIETKDKLGNLYSGTGFFFNIRNDNEVLPLLITNKHVVNNMEEGVFRLTEADVNGQPITTKHFPVVFDKKFHDNWIMHPDENVDLCAYPLLPLLGFMGHSGPNVFFRTFDNSLIPNSKQIEELDAVEDVIMVGYPNGLWDSVNNMPLVRRGITASHYKYDYNGKKEFVIDAACFPGSSGSPVLICNVGSYRDKSGNFMFGNSRILLLGILYAGPQLTVSGDIKIVTVPDAQQKALSISHIPNNLGYIIKSEKIMDFLPLFIQLRDKIKVPIFTTL